STKARHRLGRGRRTARNERWMDRSIQRLANPPRTAALSAVIPRACSEPICGTHLGERPYGRLETGPMTASDPLQHLKKTLQVGGRPHMSLGRPMAGPEGRV